jgi:hypothetical protein
VTSLVYVRGPAGPEAEKWPDDMAAGGAVGKRVIGAVSLSAVEAQLSIAELERRHPLKTCLSDNRA